MRKAVVLFVCLTVIFTKVLASEEDDDDSNEMVDSDLQIGQK